MTRVTCIILTRVTCIILTRVTCIILALATYASAAVVNYPASHVVYADRPVVVTGDSTYDGMRAAPTLIRNRQLAKVAPSFDVRHGGNLTLSDLTLHQTGWPVTNRAVISHGKVTLDNVAIRDGDGILAESGVVIMRGVQTKDSTYSYTGYFGNNMVDEAERRAGRGFYSWSRPDRDDFIVTVFAERCGFRIGRKETSVRAMGARGLFRDCGFGVDHELQNPDRRHNKQSAQFRHFVGVLERCAFGGSLTVGSLDPSIDNGQHVAYAARNPTIVLIKGGWLLGYIEVSGNTTLLIDGLRVMGRDPRGIGPNAGIDIKTFNTAFGVQRPRVLLTNVDVGHWQLNVGGVVVGPNCTRNGAKIPVSPSYSEAEFDAAKKKAEAGVPSWALPASSGPVDSLRASGDFLVGSAAADIKDGPSSDPVRYAELLNARPAVDQLSDSRHVIDGDALRSVVLVTSVPHGVFAIARNGIPPQVRETVVGRVAVVMAAFESGRSRPNERQQHEFVRVDPSPTQLDSVVAAAVARLFEDAASVNAGPTVWRWAKMVVALDAAEAAGFVHPLVAGDWTPDFFAGNVAIRHADLLEGSCVQSRAGVHSAVAARSLSTPAATSQLYSAAVRAKAEAGVPAWAQSSRAVPGQGLRAAEWLRMHLARPDLYRYPVPRTRYAVLRHLRDRKLV